MNVNDEGAAVKSATRVLDLLEVLALSRQTVGASELARRLSIPKSSTHMLLATLERRGYVLGDESRRFRLHPMFAGEGRSWVGGIQAVVRQLARESLRKLAETTGESAFLGVARDGASFEYIDKVVSEQDVRCDAELGQRRSLHSSSVGLVLLASREPNDVERYLSRGPLEQLTAKTITDPMRLRREIASVRRKGFAVTRDTNAVGASGIAVPILDGRGRVIAGLNISAPTPRFDGTVDRSAELLIKHAALITSLLAGTESEAA